MSTSSAYAGRPTWEGVLRVFLAEALFVPTGLLTAAFLTHRLGPRRYGLLALALTIVAWVDRAYVALALSALLVPLAIVGHLAVVPRMGPRGAALITLVGASLGALAQLIAVHRHWGIRPALPTIGRVAAASVVAATLAALWPTRGASLLLVKLPALGLVTVIVLGVLGEFSPAEFAAARALLSGHPANHRDRVQVP